MQNLNDIRFKFKNGGGSLWDLGSYCISFARYVLQKEPCKVFAKKIHTLGDKKVDASLAGYIVFEEGIEKVWANLRKEIELIYSKTFTEAKKNLICNNCKFSLFFFFFMISLSSSFFIF